MLHLKSSIISLTIALPLGTAYSIPSWPLPLLNGHNNPSLEARQAPAVVAASNFVRRGYQARHCSSFLCYLPRRANTYSRCGRKLAIHRWRRVLLQGQLWNDQSSVL